MLRDVSTYQAPEALAPSGRIRENGIMDRTMRRCIIATCAAAALLGGCNFPQKIERLTIDNVEIAAVRDGEYTATVRVLPVTARVRVTVKAGAITGIDLLRHFHGPDHGAEAILPRVIERQSLAVDAVSGSTYSSKVVLKAIDSALKKGR
jgi:uncharacterized protein with FMN-binding domain